MNRHILITALVAGFVCDSALVAQKDLIVTNDGRRIRGVVVTAMSLQTVNYQRSGADLELPANLLREVQWGDAPEEYALARAAARSGDLEAAANLYGEVAANSNRDVLKAECAFLSARSASQAAGDDKSKAGDAVGKLTEWLNANADHFRVPDATLALGRAQVAAGQAADAEGTFKKLADDVLSKNLPPVWSARAKFEMAKALVSKGDFGNARSAFRDAMSAAQTSGDKGSPEIEALTAEASVGVGEAMIAEGNFEEALTYFRGLSSNESTAVKAAAKAGEGEALFLQAKDKGDAEMLRAAQFALVEADLLDSTAGETSAKALYYSGMVLLALGPDHEASTFKQRAAAFFASVSSLYPDSPWAIKAAAAARN